MQKPYILYVCEPCYEHAPEGCGHSDPKDIAIMPDGTWVCTMCADEVQTLIDCGVKPGGEDEDEWPSFNDFPHPPRFVAVEQNVDET